MMEVNGTGKYEVSVLMGRMICLSLLSGGELLFFVYWFCHVGWVLCTKWKEDHFFFVLNVIGFFCMLYIE